MCGGDDNDDDDDVLFKDLVQYRHRGRLWLTEHGRSILQQPGVREVGVLPAKITPSRPFCLCIKVGFGSFAFHYSKTSPLHLGVCDSAGR